MIITKQQKSLRTEGVNVKKERENRKLVVSPERKGIFNGGRGKGKTVRGEKESRKKMRREGVSSSLALKFASTQGDQGKFTYQNYR